MKGKSLRLKLLTALGTVAVILPMIFGAVAEATPAAWNDANFKLVWERTDKPVQDGLVSRSWMWGPTTVPGSPGAEAYAEAPGGNRVVQYLDKSRMEVNDPNGDRSQLWFVTNGLLVKEMVSGQVQTGNGSFQDKGASQEAVAGDPASANPNCPAYDTFKSIASLNNDNPSSPKSDFVNEYIDISGTITTWVNPSPSPDPGVVYTYFDNNLKHNIPNVFWDFMNQSGLVYWDGGWNTETVVNWVFAMGFPITEPYWTKARVGGVERDVLVQLFERRVLTYTPSNSPAYQVEMGNVGQHYKRWRYGDTPDHGGGPARLIFIHHSTGENWLADDNGELGLTLRDNNYFVSDTNYGWGPDSIGDRTDIGHWWLWFRGPDSATYLSALYAESGQNASYSRLATAPGGENEIIMFKSCFPNSRLQGNPSDAVPPIENNPLRGEGSDSEYLTVANAKGIYIDLLNYFATRPDKLFVVVTAPPLIDETYSANARAFNEWLVNDWLREYPYKNVWVFDFYNVLTTNGGDANTNDLNRETGNHHRLWNGVIQHKTDGDDDGNPNVLEYPTEDDHPSRAGNLKATAEFVPLLNFIYQQWKG